MESSEKGPDVDHLKWSIDQRAKIQHTLLALYEYVKRPQPEGFAKTQLLDDLIAAAFSLWRACFLAEVPRRMENVKRAQERFLATVVSTNAISFNDDRKNSAWAFTFYLENARHRILAGWQLATEQLNVAPMQDVIRLLRVSGQETNYLRYEWEATHTALRFLFKELDPTSTLAFDLPVLVRPHTLEQFMAENDAKP